MGLVEELNSRGVRALSDVRSDVRTKGGVPEDITIVKVEGENPSDALHKAMLMSDLPVVFVTRRAAAIVTTRGDSGVIAVHAVDGKITDEQEQVVNVVSDVLREVVGVRPAKRRKKEAEPVVEVDVPVEDVVEEAPDA